MADLFSFVRGEGPELEALSDRELLLRVAASDEAAFEVFFHRYNRKLFSFVAGMVASEAIAKEIIQDTFLKVWLSRGEMPTIDNPSAWVYRVASNLTYDQIRADLRYAKHTSAASSDLKEPSLDTAQAIDTRALQAAVHAALKDLPPQMRESFRLIKMEGLSRKEAAAKMGLSESTVKNHLAAAVKKMQDRLREAGFHELPVILILLYLS